MAEKNENAPIICWLKVQCIANETAQINLQAGTVQLLPLPADYEIIFLRCKVKIVLYGTCIQWGFRNRIILSESGTVLYLVSASQCMLVGMCITQAQCWNPDGL